MTCIVGLKEDDGSVWIGGDSLASGYNGACVLRADPKVFRKDPHYIFGFSTSYRMGQILQHSVLPVPPKGRTPEEVHAWMVTNFVPTIRDAFKEGGWAQRETEREKGGFFLVGVAGNLFCIESDYAVACFTKGFHAIGCGEFLALGALAATRQMKDPRLRLLVVLEAVEEYNAFVRRPFIIEKLNPPEVT